MIKQEISSGVVHKIPNDLKNIILSSQKLLPLWQSLTPLARNEWICWITSAKKIETRERRIRIMSDKLLMGERRPCCWAGCIHR